MNVYLGKEIKELIEKETEGTGKTSAQAVAELIQRGYNNKSADRTEESKSITNRDIVERLSSLDEMDRRRVLELSNQIILNPKRKDEILKLVK